MNPADVVLCTINARYVHASLGLRYLAANMGELRDRTRLLEFVLGAKPAEMTERLLASTPRIIGIGVYLWNVEEATRLVAHLKTVAPEVVVVIGGPEVSFETGSQRICEIADYVITGPGDLAFPALCAQLLRGERPMARVIAGGEPSLPALRLPYAEFTERDLRERFIYVEASRGCPFKCEFCLSSLDRTAKGFDLDALLEALATLHDRGARHFRFVDRTFNLKASVGVRILEFFLERLDERLFVHFEVVPDHLPEALKVVIARFPAGVLQFEIGIQTWNEAVQANISRRQNNPAAEANLRWLREHSNALLHVDLIVGLPGEDVESFGRGFDRLYALRPHEIQVGILKRLRGTPIARHTAAYDMRYNPDPPYNVLATDRINFGDMQRLARFARYWEIVANSGRLPRTTALICGDTPFGGFMHFADWLYAATGKTGEFALERLYEQAHQYLVSQASLDHPLVTGALMDDYRESGARGGLRFAPSAGPNSNASRKSAQSRSGLRQARHLRWPAQ